MTDDNVIPIAGAGKPSVEELVAHLIEQHGGRAGHPGRCGGGDAWGFLSRWVVAGEVRTHPGDRPAPSVPSVRRPIQ